jgi:ABC-type branched-subunit amino acid transport system substrate-binding protein
MIKKINVVLLSLGLAWSSWLVAEPLDVLLYYVGPTDTHVYAGVEQGQKEANMQGQFLGQNYEVKVIDQADLASADLSVATAVLLATDAEHMLTTAQSDAFADVPVLNLTSDDDALRVACQPNLFNILPSAKMKQDALAQWQAKKSGCGGDTACMA